MPDREDTVASTRAAGLPFPGARPPLLEGRERLGAYEIVRLLGGGGMGEVYEAVDTESGHRLAIKVLPQQALGTDTARERFLREGTLAASINHPNSLYVYGTEEIEDLPLIAMELAPGGTLDDRVEAQGPMDPLEAAKAGLQIAEGLAAAAERGVLHRDVKPSNCFVDRDGTVKVGDFGLSISKTESEATQLTATGAFLGTPAYASPEQIRGQDIDVRSDIYSVGATIYFLLSGQRIFAEHSGLQLMASILEKPAKPLRELRPDVPPDLAAAVHRCLQKDPAARFSGYPALIGALTAVVESEERVPAKRLRFGAGVIDDLLIGVVSGVVTGIVSTVLKPESLTDPVFLWSTTIVGMSIEILYGGVLEGIWGATLGKAALGLRVVGVEGKAPGLGAGLLRSLLFHLPETGALALSVVFITGLHVVSQVIAGVSGFVFFVFWISARRANGWEALHDRWSRTRVVKARTGSERPRFEPGASPARSGSTATLGSFVVPADYRETPAGGVLAADDPRLARQVWIQLRGPGAPPVADARRDLSRRGRLRWLNGKRSEGESWDAYEAVAGVPLAEAVRTPQPWSVVRLWLLDLAEEIGAAADDGTIDFALDPGRVWITKDGRAMLLDVPPPGSPPREEAGVAGEPESGQGFLLRVADAALTGRNPVAADVRVPPLPLPILARDLLERLRARSFGSPAEVTSVIRGVCAQASEVGRGRRAVHYGIAAVLPVFFVVVALVTHHMFNLAEERYPESTRLSRAWNAWEKTQDPEAPEHVERKEALEIFIAGTPRDALDDERLAADVGSIRAMMLSEKEQKAIREFWETHEPPTEAELAAATEEIRPILEEREVSFELGRAEVALTTSVLSLGFLAHFVAPLAILLGGFLRGGVTLRALGIAVVTGEGRDCGRMRAALRNLFAWSPAFVIWWLTLHAKGGRFPWTFPVGMVDSLQDPAIPALALLAAVVVVAGVVWGMVRPARGPQDRVAGTWLVPR